MPHFLLTRTNLIRTECDGSGGGGVCVTWIWFVWRSAFVFHFSFSETFAAFLNSFVVCPSSSTIERVSFFSSCLLQKNSFSLTFTLQPICLQQSQSLKMNDDEQLNESLPNMYTKRGCKHVLVTHVQSFSPNESQNRSIGNRLTN